MSILPQNGGFGLFSIDPNATPDQIAKKRAMIAAMMPQYGKARYVGEGIGQLATGIATGMSNRKMDKFEADKRSEASEAYRNLVGGGPMSVLGMKDDWGTTFAAEPEAADPMSPDAIGRDAMAAIGRGGADEIRSGLIKRGLPEHIADGFIMNFQDESGLDPGINEASPLVPGSRGGFGLSQWTGPRRRALEAFAADRGTPVSNVDTQLDFLMSELQGPESAAAREIFGSKTSGEAAAAIVNKFLRPAEEHRASREARYLGGQSRVGTGPQVAYNGPSVAELSSALSNPWLSQEERGVVGMMLQQAQQANDPMRAMEMERAQLELDQLRNPQVKPININGKLVDPNTYEVIADFSEGPDPTSAMREYDLARSQGYEGTFADYKRDMAAAGRSSTTVNVGDGNNPGLGKLSTDFGYVLDPATGKPVIDQNTGLPKAAPVPGSPAAREIEAASEKKSLTNEGTARSANVVMQDIDLALKQSEGFGTTGFFGGLFDDVGGTAAHDLQNTLRTVQANIGFDRLQQMREASPTGGALGAVSERELTELQAVLGSVQQSQGKAQLQRNLNRLKALYSDILKKAQAYPNATDFGFGDEPQDEISDADYLKSLGLE